jgi:hypothetical protein
MFSLQIYRSEPAIVLYLDDHNSKVLPERAYFYGVSHFFLFDPSFLYQVIGALNQEYLLQKIAHANTQRKNLNNEQLSSHQVQIEPQLWNLISSSGYTSSKSYWLFLIYFAIKENEAEPFSSYRSEQRAECKRQAHKRLLHLLKMRSQLASLNIKHSLRYPDNQPGTRERPTSEARHRPK